MISDPYKVLGVSPDTSEEEITKAYRKLARKYHPDVNHGNEESAKKMTEINTAYEQIKNGNTSQIYTGNYQQNTGGSSNGSTSANDPFGFGFNPFEGFDFFKGGFGSNEEGRGQRSDFTNFDQVKRLLNAGYYDNALSLLNNITDRNAKWYYYSAVANLYCDNKITALKQAKTAVVMDPTNTEYQQILNHIQNGGRVYQQKSSEYGMPTVSLNKICMGILMTNLYCILCGRPC